MTVFGDKDAINETRDLKFSAYKEQYQLSSTNANMALPELGRSGRHFQLTYNLKSVVCKSKSGTPNLLQEWYVRQGVIHHQFDITTGRAFWLICHGRNELKEEVERLTGAKARPQDRDFSTRLTCFQASLEVHLMSAHWAVQGWRPYIQWLEDIVEEKVSYLRSLTS